MIKPKINAYLPISKHTTWFIKLFTATPFNNPKDQLHLQGVTKEQVEAACFTDKQKNKSNKQKNKSGNKKQEKTNEPNESNNFNIQNETFQSKTFLRRIRELREVPFPPPSSPTHSCYNYFFYIKISLIEAAKQDHRCHGN